MDHRTLQKINKLDKRQQCNLLISLMGYFTSVIAIGFGAKLLCDPVAGSSPGFRFLGLGITIIGVMLLILAFGSGIVGPITCFCNLPLVIVLGVFGIFALAASSRSGGKSVPGRSYQEYELESYSEWMQNKVNSRENWENHYIKALLKKNPCRNLLDHNSTLTLAKFHQLDLDPLESGCCKPPEECNFNYTNPTWTKTANANYSNDDCNKWSNNPYIVCFNCRSCKAAFLEDVTSHWRLTGLVFVLLSVKHFVLGFCFLLQA